MNDNTPKFKSAKKAFPSFNIKVTKREINKLKRVIKADQGYAKLHPVGSDKRIHFEKNIAHCTDLLAGWESDLQKKEIAERVIQLESIGHAYDDLTGFVYPVYADGTLDYDNFVLTGEIEKENGISDEDYKIIADCPV